MPRAAQGERLADVGDAEAGRAALERRDRGAHRAVAVAVGLDDRDDLGAGQPAQVPHVRGDRADVDGRLAQDAGGQAAHAVPPVAAVRSASASAMTYAIANPASCDIDRCRVVIPRSATTAAVDPVRREPGAPRRLGVISISVQCRPSEPPSALMSASLAA